LVLLFSKQTQLNSVFWAISIYEHPNCQNIHATFLQIG